MRVLINRLPKHLGGKPPWNRIRDVYVAWESLGNTDRKRTPEALERLYKRLMKCDWFADEVNSGNPNLRCASRRRVRKWVGDPQSYFPFVDEVLLRRAMNFEFEAWLKLTPCEHDEVCYRLATHFDPWERIDILNQPVGERPHEDLSVRMLRWYTKFNQIERDTIISTVTRIRTRLEKNHEVS